MAWKDPIDCVGNRLNRNWNRQKGLFSTRRRYLIKSQGVCDDACRAMLAIFGTRWRIVFFKKRGRLVAIRNSADPGHGL